MDTIGELRKIASRDLVDLTAGSQSIEEWSGEVLRAYRRGNRRPDKVILILERYGECYKGELYITKEDFNNRNQKK